MSENFEIHKKIALQATPEQVWQAVTTPEGQEAWSPGKSDDQDVVERTPPTRFVVRLPKAADGAYHNFAYTIEAHDDNTSTLHFVHSGSLGENWDAGHDYERMTSDGWDMYLHTLEQYLRHFADRPATRITAEAPPPASTDGSWSTLLNALGLTGPVDLGREVRLTPAGLPPIEGVVDYVEPSGGLLAVRTTDGLYRFHNMAAIGLPIALLHFIYGEIDRESTENAWKAWLDNLFAQA